MKLVYFSVLIDGCLLKCSYFKSMKLLWLYVFVIEDYVKEYLI